MERQPVESSMIQSVGYDPGTEVLEIQFQSRTKKDDSVVPGAVWQYEGVPQEVFDRFMRAESMGRFFKTFIRANYVGNKVESA